MASYVGTGVIAGRVTDINGNWLSDQEITVRSFSTGVTSGVTTSYIFQNTADDVNSDPAGTRISRLATFQLDAMKS
jgi:hypothetical protein